MNQLTVKPGDVCNLRFHRRCVWLGRTNGGFGERRGRCLKQRGGVWENERGFGRRGGGLKPSEWGVVLIIKVK